MRKRAQPWGDVKLDSRLTRHPAPIAVFTLCVVLLLSVVASFENGCGPCNNNLVLSLITATVRSSGTGQRICGASVWTTPPPLGYGNMRCSPSCEDHSLSVESPGEKDFVVTATAPGYVTQSKTVRTQKDYEDKAACQTAYRAHVDFDLETDTSTPATSGTSAGSPCVADCQCPSGMQCLAGQCAESNAKREGICHQDCRCIGGSCKDDCCMAGGLIADQCSAACQQ
jgi:hypothetical protein